MSRRNLTLKLNTLLFNQRLQLMSSVGVLNNILPFWAVIEKCDCPFSQRAFFSKSRHVLDVHVSLCHREMCRSEDLERQGRLLHQSDTGLKYIAEFKKRMRVGLVLKCEFNRSDASPLKEVFFWARDENSVAQKNCCAKIVD